MEITINVWYSCTCCNCATYSPLFVYKNSYFNNNGSQWIPLDNCCQSWLSKEKARLASTFLKASTMQSYISDIFQPQDSHSLGRMS